MGWKCEIDNTEFDTLRGFLNHLRPLNITAIDYYNKFIKNSESDGLCVECKNKTQFRNIRDGYNKYCSDICSLKSEEHRKAVRDRFKNNPDALVSFREKQKVLHEGRSEESKKAQSEKRFNTLIEKYGTNYHSERTKRQWDKRSPEDRKNLSEKIMKSRSNSLKYKNVTLNGNRFYVQGYEPSVLKILIEDLKILESDIVVGSKNIPKIDCVGRSHFPDIFIKSLNLLIDVKSSYTFNKHKDRCLENKQFAEKSGYNYAIFVFTRDPLIKISGKTKTGMTRDRELEEFKNKMNLVISSRASQEDEGSTTSL